MNRSRSFLRPCASLLKMNAPSAPCLPSPASRGMMKLNLTPAAAQTTTTPIVFTRQMTATAGQKFEVINVQSDEDFKEKVLEASSNKPVVVDFHARWCGPCKLLGPRLESILSESEGKVVMAKVDIDDLSDIAMEYGVRSVPTVMGVKNGKVLNQFIGLQDDDQIRTFVDKLVVT